MILTSTLLENRRQCKSNSTVSEASSKPLTTVENKRYK